MTILCGVLLTALFSPTPAAGQFATVGSQHQIKRSVYVYQSGSIDVVSPTWARRAYVRVWGAGGGAGGGSSSIRGGHGGAGGYLAADFKVQPGTLVFKLAVGKGGGGGPRVSNYGKGGGGGGATSVTDKNFTALLRAGAGGGGGGSAPGGETGGAGGAGGGVAEPGLAACANPITDCGSAGAQGVRGQTVGGAAGGRHGGCGILFSYEVQSTGNLSTPVGAAVSGGAAGTCSNSSPNSGSTSGTGISNYDNGVDRCSAGGGGMGSPGGGGGGVEANANISCAGGGGGVNFYNAGIAVRAEVSAVRATAPLPNDTDLSRNANKYASGGTAAVGVAGTAGGDGLVVIYWY